MLQASLDNLWPSLPQDRVAKIEIGRGVSIRAVVGAQHADTKRCEFCALQKTGAGAGSTITRIGARTGAAEVTANLLWPGVGRNQGTDRHDPG